MTKYVIQQTREWYGPSETRSLVDDGLTGRAITFNSPKDAREYINHLQDERYYLAHNEAARPTYKVRSIAGLPTYLAVEA